MFLKPKRSSLHFQGGANVISYNAALEAACCKAHGQDYELFLQARRSGLCNRDPTILELHDMSAGAGWMAVRWWLLEVWPAQL